MDETAVTAEDAVAQLQDLREWLDHYGTTSESRLRPWDEVLDDYDELLTTIAGNAGVEVPKPPERLQRRLSSTDRAALESELANRGIQVRRG